MTEPQMYQASSEIYAQVNGGDIWMLVNKESNVIESAHSSREIARAARNGDTNLKPIQFQSGETKIEIVKPAEEPAEVTMTAEPGEINLLDAVRATGLNVIVIDENTDFSKMPNLNVGQRDEAFDNPHHGHMDKEMTTEEAQQHDKIEQDFRNDDKAAADAAEFAADKETNGDTQPSVKAVDPAKEVKKPKVISHKSTVEKPTRLVHAIADMLFEADPEVTRKEIIEACTAQGIAHYTILTQYQAWRNSRNA